MNKRYDILEICLQEIENGAEMDAVLMRYPDLADELRPILDASIKAHQLTPPAPSREMIQRNRVKILQHAAELRELNFKPRPSIHWFAPLRQVVTALATLLIVLATGTNLVGASAASLPGENLYPVKRAWEKMQVALAFDPDARQALEIRHENERLEELHGLFKRGQETEVTFSGLISRQQPTEWLVAGIPVVISADTNLPDQPVAVEAGVRVTGVTRPDGTVEAVRIELLPNNAALPDLRHAIPQGPEPTPVVESESGSATEMPQVAITSTPSTPEGIVFDGTLNVLDDGFWEINGVPADVSNAQIIGVPAVGAPVVVYGYFNEDGVFIVTRIEFVKNDANVGGGSNSNNNENNNSGNDNNRNDNDNGNENDNHNDNDNDNDD